MKRYAWFSLGMCLSLGAVACDDGDGGKQSGETPDGGSGSNYDDEIADLRGDLDMLGMDLGGRLTKLETPVPPGSCSQGELCVPDGVALASQGMQPIVQALCANEVKCCDAGELNWIYGPAVKTAADCEAAFGELVNRGAMSSSGVFGEHLMQVLDTVRALNDTEIRVEINAAAVQACATSIQGIQCPSVGDAVVACAPPAQDACSPAKLLKGLEQAGETCDPYNAQSTKIPECAEGLACRQTSLYVVNPKGGVCAPKAKVDDRCTQPSECDDLFCNFTTGKCQLRAKEGETCAFVDPTFVDVSPFNSGTSGFGTGVSTLLDCEEGFSCDPTSNKCVRSTCVAGSYCTRNSACGAGLVCNGGASTPLQERAQNNTTFYGLCTPPTADGGACLSHFVVLTTENNCASGICSANVCAPPLKADGVACASPGAAAAECKSGYCDSASKCAPTCTLSTPCAAGHYCAETGSVDHCVPELAAGATCSVAESCASKFCNNSLQCAAKKADGVTCTGIQSDVECQSGWCKPTAPNAGTYACAQPLAENAACDVESTSFDVCASGLYCAFGADEHSGTCRKQARTGEVCSPRYDHADCLNGGFCTIRRETFLCNDVALPHGELFCRD